MKKMIKSAAIIMTAMVAIGAINDISVFAVEENEIQADMTETEVKAVFIQFKGKVTEEIENTEKMMIRLKNEEGTLLDVMLDENTFLTSTKEPIQIEDLKKGDEVTVYYVLPEVMTMQYPPKITGSMVVQYAEAPYSAYVGVFDESNLGYDKALQINIADTTEIVNQRGEAYSEDIVGKPVVVYYTMETMSLPPQTLPSKVIVFEGMKTELDKVSLGDRPVDEKPQDYTDEKDIPNMSFFINGVYLEGAKAYVKEGTTMVPLRSVAEAMGFEVQWDDLTKNIRVGAAITMNVGVNEYTIGRAMPINLKAAPEITDGVTYVPINFFTDIVGASYNALEGNIDLSYVKN